jgi:hypothetical protein
MAASAPDPEIPLGFQTVVNHVAGQTIFAWNRPFRRPRADLRTSNARAGGWSLT